MSSSLMYWSASSSWRARDRFLNHPCFACSARTMFSRTERSSMIPSPFRSSGQRPMPACSARSGLVRLTLRPRTVTSPWSAFSIPKMRLAISVRPEPSSPASPSTSPGVDLEVEGLHDAGLPQVLHAQHRLAGAPGRQLLLLLAHALQVLERLPQELRHELHLGQAGGLELAHQLAVAEDGDAVRHRVHLLEEVGHEEDGVPLGLELPHDREELLHLARRRGWRSARPGSGSSTRTPAPGRWPPSAGRRASSPPAAG